MTDQHTYPKVTIIIPTYNRAGLIMETIESVREQTYSNWELIIVDDGSDDNTEVFIRQLSDERISYIKCERSGIGGKVKNTGITKARGELIAFVDSDDLWDKTKIEKQVAVLAQYPDAGFCLTNGYNFKRKEEPVDFFYKQREGMLYDNVFTAIFKSEVAGFSQALLFKKECLQATGMFKEEKSFSDLDFIICLADHYKAVILYEPLIFRRLHESNYIHSTWEKNYKEGIDLIFSNRTKLPAVVYKNAMFRAYINYGEKCLLYKQRVKAIKQFLKAWGYRPFSIIPLKKTGKAILNFLNKTTSHRK